MIDENIIPFDIDDNWQGFAKTQGLLSFDGNLIKLEFQTTDSVVGLLKSKVKIVKINPSDLSFVKFGAGMFKDNLIFCVKSLKLTEDLPLKNNHEIFLKIKKRYKEQVKQTVSQINLRIAEIKLENSEKNL